MGLLDGIAGLMGDPNQAALLGLSSGLLSAGGPSRMPVSLGQAIGTGVQGMNQAYQGGLQRQMQQQQIASAAMQNLFLRGKLGMIDSLMGGKGQKAQKNAMQQSLSAPVLQYGAQQNPNTPSPDGSINNGGVGPTNQNAAMLNSATNLAMQSQPQGGTDLSALSGQLINQGVLGPWLGVNNSSLVGTGLANDPQVQRQLAIAKNPQIVSATFANNGDTSAAQEALRNVLTKQGSIAVSRNGMIRLPNGQIILNPATAPGVQNVYDPNGTLTHQAVIPGAPQAIAASAGANSAGSQAGKLAYTPQSVYNPQSGQMGQALGGNLYGLSMGPNGISASQGAAQNGFVPTAAPIGTNQAIQSLSKEYADQGLQLPGIKNSLDGLSKALDLVNQGVVTGPGSERKFDLSGLLNTWHIPVSKDATTNYQLAYKYLSNANNQAMGAMGMSGSDARMEQFLHGNPNAHTMGPQALASAIEYVRGQQSGVIANYSAKTAWLNSHGGNYTTLPQFNAAWGKAYDPNVMVLQQMDPAQGAAWLNANAPKGMTPDQFRAKIAKSAAAMAQLGAFQ